MVQVSASDLNYHGQPAALGVIRDVTELKKLERQLIQADKLVSIGTLVSGVAHEVNNPLNGAMGRAQLLLRGDLEPAMRRDLQVIQDEIERAVRTMRNLLSFAREYTPEKLFTSINTTIESALELRRYELATSGIGLTTDLQDDLPNTMADAHQLQQVFLNVLVNAEQAMLGTTSAGAISVKTRQVGNTIQVTIADNGPGMTEAVLTRAFDPFYTTKSIGQGTGLGLSICYGIVQEHGGDIRVDSQVGEGTTFTIELPITTEI